GGDSGGGLRADSRGISAAGVPSGDAVPAGGLSVDLVRGRVGVQACVWLGDRGASGALTRCASGLAAEPGWRVTSLERLRWWGLDMSPSLTVGVLFSRDGALFSLGSVQA